VSCDTVKDMQYTHSFTDTLLLLLLIVIDVDCMDSSIVSEMENSFYQMNVDNRFQINTKTFKK